MTSRELDALEPFQQSIKEKVRVWAGASLSGGELALVYKFDDPYELVQWPAPAGRSQRRDRLWMQTCMEAFVKSPGGESYWEYNFSPGGEWNCYAFSDYRHGQHTAADVDRALISKNEQEFEVRSPLPRVLRAASVVHMNLAVIVLIEQQRYHFALSHGQGHEPDFHKQSNFIKIITTR